jgi:glycine cleavage system transcriptional repressor
MSARRYLVLSALGPDRPGLVAELTAWVCAADGNVEDSRMAVLGGLFGIMMLVSGEADTLEQLRAGQSEAERASGLGLTLTPTTAPSEAAATARLLVDAESLDREGIVRGLAECLLALGGNIIDLNSSLYPAPVSGAPLFRCRITVDVPAAAKLAARTALGELAAAEGLDVEVTGV